MHAGFCDSGFSLPSAYWPIRLCREVPAATSLFSHQISNAIRDIIFCKKARGSNCKTQALHLAAST